MSSAFNLTAQLNLRGPNNVGQIVADIRRQIGTINGDINFRIDPNTTRNVTQLNAGLRTLNATFAQTQRSASDAANALRAFGSAVGGLGNTANIARNITNAATATQRLQQNANTATRDLGGARSEMEEFGRQSALAIRRFAAFSVVTSTVFALTNAVGKGVSAFIEYDKQFVKLQQVTGESATGLSKLSNTITSLSKDFGVASSELTTVASTLAQAGLSARDTERALKALALSALAPSFDDMNKTVEGSIALMKQFGISAKDLEASLGAVNAVSAKFAVEAGDIIAAIQRTGGVFASASKGVSEGKDALNEFIAVFTSVRATTRESAETIATGLRTIFTRIQRGGTIEALKEFGVTLTDAEGKFVGAYKAVQLLSEGLNRIDPRDIKFSQIVEELGGFRQIGKVIPLIQQFATAQDALRTAQQGQGSLAEDAAIAQLSLANQIAKVREEFLALFREIGSSDSFQTIAKGALDVASALIKVADSVKGVLPILGIMLAVRGASGITQFGAGFTRGIRRGGGGGGGGRGAANGGMIRGYKLGGQVNNVPVALTPGEAVVYPEAVKQIGVSRLQKMNHADRQKRAKGGSVGIVPGSGNSDSFYTSLPEGSFVIRKKATEALGENNIKSIATGRKKFREGGILPYIKAGNKTVGAAILEPGNLISSDFTISPQTVEKVVGSKLKNLPTLGNFKAARQGLSPDTYGSFDKALNEGIVSGVNKSISVLAKDLGTASKTISEEHKQSFLQGINNATRGNLFEDVLLSLKEGPGPFSKRDAQQPFDFPGGLSGVLKDDFLGLPPAWVDAKASFKTAQITGGGSLRSKTLRQIVNEINASPSLYKDNTEETTKEKQNTKTATVVKKQLESSTIASSVLQSKIDEYKGLEFQSEKVQARAKEIGLSSRSQPDVRKFLKEGKIPTRGGARTNVLQFLGISGKALGGLVKLANGGMPLVDDLPNAPGSMLPMPGIKPGSPLYEIIKNKGGAIDYDRTLQRTVGDAAYASAKTAEAKEAVLQKYFRDPKARLEDAKSARLTQFGVQLKDLIKKGIIEPRNLSIISKSSRTAGLPEHISKLFGIPPQNMVFTSGGSKLPALEAMRTKGPRVARVSRASGGEVPILAQEGEYVINRKSARAIGYGNLGRLNKYHTGGKVQRLARGSFNPLTNPGDAAAQSQARAAAASQSLQIIPLDVAQADAAKKFKVQLEEIERVILNFGGQDIKKKAQEIKQASGGKMTSQEALASARRGTEAAQSGQIKQITSSEAGRDILKQASASYVGRGVKTGLIQQQKTDIKESVRTTGMGARNTFDRADILVKQAAQQGKVLSMGDAVLRSLAIQDKLDKEISEIKKKTKDKYVKSLVNIAKRGIEADKNIDLIDRQNRAERVGRAKQNRSGFFRQTAQRFDTVATNATARASSGGMISSAANTALANFAKGMSTVNNGLANMSTQTRAFSINLQRDPLGTLRSAAVSAAQALTGTSKAAITTGNNLLTKVSQGIGKFTNSIMGGTNDNGVARDSGGRRRRGFGRSDSRGSAGSNALFAASFAIPMITDMISGGEAQTASQAGSQKFNEGASTSVGSGIMVGQMVSQMTSGMGAIGALAGPVAGIGVAAIGVAKAMADASNAAKEFAINEANSKMEMASEKAASSIQKFANNIKNADLETKALKDTLSTISAAETVRSSKEVAQRGIVNLGDSGEGSFQRGEILFNKGINEYLQTLSLFAGSTEKAAKNQEIAFSSLIPQQARGAAKDFAPAADVSSQFLEQQFKKGQTVSGMQKEDPANFDKLTRSLALADVAVQEQIMNVKNNSTLTANQKDEITKNITAIAAETKAREIEARVFKASELDRFNKDINKLQNSLERMFQNMEQSINANVFALDNMSQKAELNAAALSGQAKSGNVKLQSVNVLQNPRAYDPTQRSMAVNQAANMFGGQEQTMRGLLNLTNKMEDSIMSTINKTIKEDPTASNEKIGIRIQDSISSTLKNLQLPPDISEKLGKQVNDALGQIRTKGDEKIDFGDLMEKIPALGKVLDSAKRAQELAVKALEHWQNNVNDYSNAMNQMVEIQIDTNSKLRRANDIMIRGQMELDKALGKEVSLRDQVNVVLNNTKNQTGGAAAPADIAANIRTLETSRQTQEAMKNAAVNQGPAGSDEFRLMENRLKNTNIALRENYDALKNMADNTEIASAALSKINDIQQQRQAQVGIAERLVTSNPEELSNLNRAMARLDNNMKGITNVGTSAEDRRSSLDAFNMIAPLLGENQGGMKANVLESMLKESGVGISPMMQEMLQSLRNPEADPQMQEAINTYKSAIVLQTEANRQLASLNTLMSQNMQAAAIEKLNTALTPKFTFQESQLNDINKGIQNLIDVVQNNPGAMTATPKARGGIIYASAGQMVDFKPQGTDTVPAMLTPGEFVVNRQATQRNLPLLKNINNGYSRGGKVNYYADGGLVAMDQWKPAKYASSPDALNTDINRRNKLEKESDNTYIKLNTDAGYPSQNVFTVPGKFHAVNDTPGILRTADRGSVDQLTNFTPQASAKLGAGYPKLSIPFYGGLGFFETPKMGVMTEPRTIPIPAGKLPTSGFFSDLLGKPDNPNSGELALDQVRLSKNKDLLENYKTKLNNILSYLSTWNIEGEEVTSPLAGKIKLNVPNIEMQPKVKATDSELEISGLTATDSNKYSLFSQTNIDAINSARDPGNLYGLKHYGGLLGGEYSVVAGLDNFRSIYGSSGIKPYPSMYDIANYSGGDRNSFIANNKEMYPPIINKIKKLRERIKQDLINLKTERFTSETQSSVSNKKNFSILNQLYDGTLFSSDPIESGDLINNPGSVRFPITLYSSKLASRWASDFVPKIESSLKAEDNFENSNFSLKTGGSDLDRFIKIANPDGSNPRDIPYTDSLVDKMALINEQQAFATDESNKNIVSSIGSVTGKDYSFNYNKIKGRFYNPVTMDYIRKDPKEFIALQSVSSTDEAILGNNPFASFSLDPNSFIYETTIEALRSKLDAMIKEDRSNLDLNLISKVNPDNLSNIEPFTFKSSGEDQSPLINTFTANLSKFKEARKKRIEKEQAEEAKRISGKAMMGEQTAIRLNEGMRISLARSAYDALVQSGAVSLQPGGPTDVDGIKRLTGELYKVEGSKKENSVERATVAAYRKLFYEIGNGDGTNLQKLGLDLRPESFGKAKTARITVPGSNVPQLRIVGYEGGIDRSAAIKDIITRQVGIERSGAFGGSLNETDLMEKTADGDLVDPSRLVTDGARIVQVDPKTGSLTTVTPDAIIPKTFNDVRKLALNPYNEFAAIADRSTLFDSLINHITSGTDKNNQPLYPQDVKNWMLEKYGIVKSWFGGGDKFKGQDFYLNTKPVEESLVSDLKNDDTKKALLDKYALTSPAFDALTIGEFGKLPDYNWIMSKIMTKMESEKQVEEAEKKARGGMIYASKGTLVNYQPRGTDTVPAMLTPGEFVVNRSSTQQHLPLLKAINSGTYSHGDLVQKFNRGGIVFPNYHSFGAMSGSSNASMDLTGLFKGVIDQFSRSIDTAFNSILQRTNSPAAATNGVSSNIDYNALSKFSENLASVSRTLAALDNIPSEIKITGRHDVNVIINGDTALNQLSPSLQSMVADEINKAFKRLKDENPSLQNSIDVPTSPTYGNMG